MWTEQLQKSLTKRSPKSWTQQLQKLCKQQSQISWRQHNSHQNHKHNTAGTSGRWTVVNCEQLLNLTSSCFHNMTNYRMIISKSNQPTFMWPWLWTHKSNIFIGHFGLCQLWWSTIKLSLVAKESLVQKIQQNRSYFSYRSPHLKFEDSNSVCLPATVALDDAPPYHVCLQEAEQFRIHFLDNAWTHTHTYSNIQSCDQSSSICNLAISSDDQISLTLPLSKHSLPSWLWCANMLSDKV